MTLPSYSPGNVRPQSIAIVSTGSRSRSSSAARGIVTPNVIRVPLETGTALLSPFDPLLFGMLGACAMALVLLGRYEEASGWAVKAAARPNAHPHIYGIAAFSLALAGSTDEARRYAATVRKMSPRYRARDFLGAFHFDDEGAARFTEGARRIGMS